MTEIAHPVYLKPSAQAEALAEALAKFGFSTEVRKWRDYLQHPCVVIRCGDGLHVRQTEYIYAAPLSGDPDGQYWWWRVSPDDPLTMTILAPISDVSVTVDVLMRSITMPQIQDGSNGA